MSRSPRPQLLPGDAPVDTDRMIRVDQAGEYGASRIYAGQRAVMGSRHPSAKYISHMAEQEDKHLASFNQLMLARGTRPSLLAPFWHVAGFALGAGTALLGPRAAMACTAAIEEVIEDHYSQQLTRLQDKDPELADVIIAARADEVAHHNTAIAQGARQTPGYPLLAGLIKAGCRAAIAVAERV